MNRILLLLTAAAVAYTALCLALFVVQRSFIYYPRPRTVITPRSTMVLAVDGADLVVSVRPHGGPNALVYFGGNAEDVSVNLPPFAEAFPDHALYLLHYRGYGGSSGTPTERSNYRDALALFEKVHAEHASVAVVGRSLGTGIAVWLASHAAVSRLVLITPYDNLQDVAAPRFPFLPVRWLLRERYDSGALAGTVKATTRFIVAEDDEIIPRASTEQLFVRFPSGVAAMTILAGTGHNTISDSGTFMPELQAAVTQTTP